MQHDFLAIGDTTVDEFIKLKDAEVHCNINHEECTISMKWGDKIPFELAILVAGVGNAANAAVAAARLGLSTSFLSNVGNDRYGEEILATFKREHVDTTHVHINDGIPTNHHYVLWFHAERTILIKHEDYPYVLPENLEAPRWMYLSSAGEKSEQFHLDLASWLIKNPSTKLAFQPGTFQMKMGKEKLKDLYARTELVACNKEEAQRILEITESDVKVLLTKMRELGPKIALITDGPNGLHAFDGSQMLYVPMFPDPKPPVDRTGAGDACTATIAAALAMGEALETALLWGPINSMSVVQEIGAQKGLLSKAQIEEWYAKRPAEYKASAI